MQRLPSEVLCDDIDEAQGGAPGQYPDGLMHQPQPQQQQQHQEQHGHHHGQHGVQGEAAGFEALMHQPKPRQPQQHQHQHQQHQHQHQQKKQQQQQQQQQHQHQQHQQQLRQHMFTEAFSEAPVHHQPPPPPSSGRAGANVPAGSSSKSKQQQQPPILQQEQQLTVSDSFVNRVGELFASVWKVRPDVALRDRYGDKRKGALSVFWQDYKKVRVDWRELAGVSEDVFQLKLAHYMQIDGPSRDNSDNRIKYIVRERIKDNTHLGVMDGKNTKAAKRKAAAAAAAAALKSPHALQPAVPLVRVKTEEVGLDSEEETRTKKRTRESMLAGPARGAAAGAGSSAVAGDAPTTTPSAAKGPKQRGPNHWWERDLTPEGCVLHPTANCHEWTSDNGIEHRIMEIEFQHGCEMKPPKERLIENFTTMWRPNCDVVYVHGCQQEGMYFEPIMGIYEKQVSTFQGKFLYRQSSLAGREGVTWLYFDKERSKWVISENYLAQPSSPLFEYSLPPVLEKLGVPAMQMGQPTNLPLFVKSGTTLLPPMEMYYLHNLEIRQVCDRAWRGCFRANPSEVAFGLFARLASAQESFVSQSPADHFAAEAFDAEREQILEFFLVFRDESPDGDAGKVVRREDYLAFMEWFVGTLPSVSLPLKIWRMYHALKEGGVPFIPMAMSNSQKDFNKHFQLLESVPNLGRYCFRFSRQPHHVTVDYTVSNGFEGGRATVKVMSHRIKISDMTVSGVTLRVENLMLRWEGQGGGVGRQNTPSPSPSDLDQRTFLDMFHNLTPALARQQAKGSLMDHRLFNGGANGQNATPLNLDYVEYSSFAELEMFFSRTLVEKCDTSKSPGTVELEPTYLGTIY